MKAALATLLVVGVGATILALLVLRLALAVSAGLS